MGTRRWIRWSALVAALVLVLAACSDDGSSDEAATTTTTAADAEADTDSDADADADADVDVDADGDGAADPDIPAPVVEVAAGDFFLEAPAEIPSGAVTVTMTNGGVQAHHVQIARLADGLTSQNLIDAAASGELPVGVPEGLELLGGPNVALPGGAMTTAMSVLEPGSYSFFCVIPDDATGVPHLALGMGTDVTVVEAEAPAAAPVADWEIGLTEMAFVVPDGFDGQGVVDMTNVGEQDHELIIVRINDGATKEDIDAFFLAPPGTPPPEGSLEFGPAMGATGPISGIVGVDPGGGTASNDMALDPGSYALYCFFENTDEELGPLGLPHALLGMTAQVDIA